MILALSCLDPKNNVTSLLKTFGEIARLVKKSFIPKRFPMI